jgi:tRNA A-37 threonylcarbamoyl transferase component Bud32
MDRIGRYKIVGELGRGAMGVVYHAIDPNIGRSVAIKTIHFGAGRKPEEQNRLRERLFREARSAGILSHPGIVTIYDVEQQGELAYIAMEFVDGPTLDQVLSDAQPIPPERMFSILGQTSVALDYAHQKGIVHRDIKPANIMIARDGTAKIADFGIAKITAADQLTMTGNIVGTPHYMSPEQVQGQPVDGRSDQFSLAVIAFEMLTGEKPYAGEHLTTVVYKIVAEEPAAPHRLNPTIGVAIESVLRKSLAKKPDLRYATCQEFAGALEKACASSKGWKTMPRGGSLNEPTMVDSAKPVAMLPPARRARAEATTTPERAERRTAGFLPFLLAILVAAGLLALIGWQAAPWLSNQVQATKTPAPPPAAPAPPATATAPVPVPAEPKPSPMPPPATTPAETAGTPPAPTEKPPAKPAPAIAATQPVSIISSPAGATATLDGNPEKACKAPCSLDAQRGRHTIAITMPGYQIEHRDVDVESSPVETLPVILRPLGGTLLLASVPAGAAISVNGRPIPQVTPAQIPLSPGTYTIAIEKDGKQASATVEIRNGAITHQRIVLE